MEGEGKWPQQSSRALFAIFYSTKGALHYSEADCSSATITVMCSGREIKDISNQRTDWMRSAVGRSWGQVSQSLRQGAALFLKAACGRLARVPALLSRLRDTRLPHQITYPLAMYVFSSHILHVIVHILLLLFGCKFCV